MMQFPGRKSSELAIGSVTRLEFFHEHCVLGALGLELTQRRCGLKVSVGHQFFGEHRATRIRAMSIADFRVESAHRIRLDRSPAGAMRAEAWADRPATGNLLSSTQAGKMGRGCRTANSVMADRGGSSRGRSARGRRRTAISTSAG